jgi:anti-sigma-K factor RskA
MKKFQDRSSHKLSRSSQFSGANSNGFWREILAAFSSIVVVVSLAAILYALYTIAKTDLTKCHFRFQT